MKKGLALIAPRKRNRASKARADVAIPSVIVVPSKQYKRLMGPDTAGEVPAALRELVLKRRAAHVR